ncbi:MAG: hypothetical protein ACREVA_04250 [Burkholderiales bacterium]
MKLLKMLTNSEALNSIFELLKSFKNIVRPKISIRFDVLFKQAIFFEVKKMIIRTNEKFSLVFSAVNSVTGNTVRVDGLPMWSASEPDVVMITVSEDGMTAVIAALAPGNTNVFARADADLDPGDDQVREISGMIDVTVMAIEEEADTVILQAGPIELQ